MTPDRHHNLLQNPVWLIIAFAAAVRIAYVIAYASLPEWAMLTVDNYYHHNWAQAIAQGDVFGDTTYFRAPLYVYSLAALYALFGPSLWAARLFGQVIGVCSVGVTYLLGRRATSHRVGLLAATAHAIWPTALYFEAELLLDPLFLLLLELAVWRTLVWFDSGRNRDVLCVGILIGLAAITRPTALVLLPIIAAVIVFYRIPRVPPVRPLLMLALGLAVTVGPIFARNVIVAHDPVLIASQGGINLYIGNNDAADGVSATLPEPLGFNWQIRDVVHIAQTETGRNLKPGEVSSFWNDRAIEWMWNNPRQCLSLYLKKLYRNISNEEISNNRALAPFFERMPLLRINSLGFALLFAFAVVGLIAATRNNRKMRIIAGALGLYVLAGTLYFFNSRFRLPVLPLYFVFAAAGAIAIIEAFRENWMRFYWLAGCAVIAGLISYLPLVPLPTGTSPQAYLATANHAFAIGDYQTALRYALDAERAAPTFPEVNLIAGNAYLRLGDIELARRYYEREAAFHPTRSKAFTNLASLALVEGDVPEALRLTDQALRLRPYDYDANLLRLRAIFNVDSASPADLLNEVEAAAARTDNDIYLLNEAGILLTNRGMIEPARTVLMQALSASPPPIEMDDAAFLPAFRHSRERIHAQYARASYQLGFIAGITGRYAEAVEFSRRAIEFDSSLADAWVNLVNGYLAIGRREEALSLLSSATERFPANSNLIRLRRQLNLQE